MVNNPIKNTLKSDHLFLLVGTNPLPDWVAARLLLNPGGRLYLVRSNTTLEVAQRLARFAISKGFVQPVYVDIGNNPADPYKPESIYKAISKQLAKIESGAIGFNYSGGTKVMAVHGYLTFKDNAVPGVPPVVFSYLEASPCVMRFDKHIQHCPTGAEYNVGLVDDVSLSFKELLDLHDDFLLDVLKKEPLAEPVCKLLVEAHSSVRGQRAWRDGYSQFRRSYDKSKSVEELRQDFSLLPPDFVRIIDELIPGESRGTETLWEAVQSNKWGFESAGELLSWLDGQWLEHYVLQHLKGRPSEYRLGEYGRNLRTQRINAAIDLTEVEIDVAAMRGYQLHLLSCYSGNDKKTCKSKLFEVLTRARQMGGEAARAALVCCSDDPQAVEADIGEVWDLKDQVKVFGRADLRKLGDHLRDWFETGAKP